MRQAHGQRLALAALFFVTGCLKVISTSPDARIVIGEAPLSVDASRLMLQTIGVLEMAVAVGLVTRLWRTSLVVATGLCATFWAYLVFRQLLGTEGSCGCFGAAELPLGAHLAIVIVAFGIGVWGLADASGTPVVTDRGTWVRR